MSIDKRADDAWGRAFNAGHLHLRSNGDEEGLSVFPTEKDFAAWYLAEREVIEREAAAELADLRTQRSLILAWADRLEQDAPSYGFAFAQEIRRIMKADG